MLKEKLKTNFGTHVAVRYPNDVVNNRCAAYVAVRDSQDRVVCEFYQVHQDPEQAKESALQYIRAFRKALWYSARERSTSTLTVRVKGNNESLALDIDAAIQARADVGKLGGKVTDYDLPNDLTEPYDRK